MPEIDRLLPVRSAGITAVIEINKITVRDLHEFPEDNNRYELIDGVVLIDGQEPTLDEWAYLWLYTRLAAVCPPEMDVLAVLWKIRAAFNVDPEPDLYPDLLVAPCLDPDGENPPGQPLLAVELLSWRNNLMDQGTRMQTYARLGVRSLWLVDQVEPMLLAYELDEAGQYRRTAKIIGAEPFETTMPFPVRLVLTEPLGRNTQQN
jgi:Uma2 family endonuclease